MTDGRNSDGERLPACRACGAHALTPAFEAPGPFLFLACDTCGSLNLDDSPAHDRVAARHAPGPYHDARRRKFPAALEAAVGLFRDARARAVAARLPTGGAVLDIGCGRGHMLAGLARRGYRAAGTEVSPESARAARSLPGVQVETGEGALDGFVAASFDAVCMFHSLEHMDSPHDVLRQVRTLLAPGGEVVIEVPLLSAMARAMGPAWFHLDPPRHLVLFSALGLRKTLGRAGLRVTKWKTFSLEFSAPSLFFSLGNRLAPGYPLYPRLGPDRAPGERVLAAVATLLGSALCLPAAGVLALSGQGDVVRLRAEADVKESA